MEQLQSVSEKDKSIQIFNSFDVLTVVMSGLIVLVISLTVVHRNNEQNKIQMTKNKAKSFAEELVQNPVNSSTNKERSPANDTEGNNSGKIGKDLWGKAFTYKVIQNSYGQPIYMAVLSSGPDGRLETDLNQTVLRDSAQLNIKGDDIGYLKSFR